MQCYKDKTFCDFDGCEDYKQCHRKLTKGDLISAGRLGLSISKFLGKPECYRKKEDNDK